MASSFLDEDQILFINRKIVDKITSVLVKIACWGSNKQSDESFEHYLKTKRSMSDSKFKRHFSLAEDDKKIKQTNFNDLDVTFLCKLLSFMCDGIVEITKWKNIKDINRLEYQLHQIKELRNELAHEPDGDRAKSKTLPSEVEKIAMNVLEIAGNKYSKTVNEINTAKDEAKKLITDITNTVTNNCREIIINEGLEKLREKVESFKGTASHYLNHVTGFYKLQLTHKEKVEGKVTENIISCDEIITYAKEKGVRILFIEGQSGAGKSSIMREFQVDLLRKEGVTRTFKGNDEFKTPLLFKCRTQTCEKIVDFALQEFPCLAGTLKNDGIIEKVLYEANSIFLIDGLDELNRSSKKFVENVSVFLKNYKEAFCIFTSRPYSVDNFQTYFKREGISFHTLTIKKLDSEKEQVEFLESSCEKGNLISDDYKRSHLNIQSPVILSIYGYFWLHNPEWVEKFRNPAHIMRATIDYGLTVARQQLYQRNILNCKDAADNILDSICSISFYCLLVGKLDLETSEIKSLKTHVKNECACVDIDQNGKQTPVNIAPMEILSSFFPSNASDSSIDDIQFYHKTQQETFAALYVAQKIIETGKNIKQIIDETLKESDYDICGFLQRYAFVVTLKRMNGKKMFIELSKLLLKIIPTKLMSLLTYYTYYQRMKYE